MSDVIAWEDVLRMTNRPRARIRAWMRIGKFPKCVMTEKRPTWYAADVQAWLAAKQEADKARATPSQMVGAKMPISIKLSLRQIGKRMGKNETDCLRQALVEFVEKYL